MTSHAVTFTAGLLVGGWLLHHAQQWGHAILAELHADAVGIGDPDGAR